MTSSVKNHLERGKITARGLLDTNNSVRSDTTDKLISLLESGESSGVPRDQIDHFLDELITNDYKLTSQRNSLRACLSIKEKIAHMVGVIYDNTLTTPPAAPANFENKDLLKNKLDSVIKLLETRLIDNQEFTESWMLRHAAFNGFECKLSNTEQSDLNTIANKLKKLCEDNGFETLAETTHFTNESNAQKIIKISEVVKQLTAHGLSLDGELIKKIDNLDDKVKPLKDLDKQYKHLINTLNMTSNIAAKKYPSMIHIKHQEQLVALLKERNKDQKDFILPMVDNKEGGQFELLEQKLSILKQDAQYTEMLKKYHLTDNQFTEWFLVYFSYKNVEKAKGDLENQKMKTFGHRVKDYEQDAAKRRGNLRGRIFEIGGRMTGNQTNWHGGNPGATPVDFSSNEDFEVANSYFNKFQNMFYANERDAYGENAHDKESHYLTMRNTIAAILRRRAPALCNGGHRRYGSLPRKAAKWLEWFAKGQEEKGFWKMVSKTWHHADHAEILAMVIMLQNQSSQQMFHGKNPFQHKDSRFGKIFRGMGLAEENRQKLGENISPYTNKFLKFFEVSTKAVAKPIVAGAELYNKGLKDYKRWKTPFYAALPATWLIAKGKSGYAATKKYLSEVKGKDVNYLYESVTDAVDGITKMGAQTVSSVGSGVYKNYQTNQQKGVLNTFFELASEDDKWKEVLQSSDLANIFNFQNRETYLFDEDGRVQMVDKKEDENKQIKAGKELAKTIKEQLEQMQKGIDDKKDTLEKNIESAINSNNGNEDRFFNALQRLESRSGDIMNIKSELEKIMPLLKDPAGNIANIQTNLNNLNNSLTIAGGPIATVTARISEINDTTITPPPATAATGTTGTANPNSKLHWQLEIQKEETSIRANNSTIKANTGNTPGERGARSAAEEERSQHENNKKHAEQQIRELNQEVMELRNRESWLKRISSVCTTIVPPVVTPVAAGVAPIVNVDEDTLKSISNSLDLLLYKPTTQQTKQQTANNLAGALATP